MDLSSFLVDRLVFGAMATITGNVTMGRRLAACCPDNFRLTLAVMWDGVKWIHLVQGRVQWWALEDVAMNLWFYKERDFS
jgi:hypothetical protein